MKEKIKILFTIPNFDTAGSGKAMLKVAMGLNNDLFEPHIACFHDRGVFFETVRKSGIPVHLLEYTSPERPVLKCLKECWKKRKFFKQFNIVHSYHYSADYTEGLAVRMAGRKWVFTKKNMNWGGSSARAWKLRSKLANKIAVQNHDMEREFYPGLDKTYYLTRGVDTHEFFPRERDLSLLQELGIDTQAKIILCVANLVPVKGIEILLDAFSRLEKENVYLLIVGDKENDYGQQMQALSQSIPNGDKVFFVGKRLDVWRFHTIADVFVLPTLNQGRKEGSPVSLLEAMASGEAVIASAIPGIKDQLANFPDLMFEAGNAVELKTKLEHLLNLNNADMQDLQKRLVAEIQANFTIEKEIRRHEELYLSLMNQK